MRILGVQIDKPFIRTAVLHKHRKSFKICTLKSTLLANLEDVKSLYMPGFKGRVVSGLPARDFVLHPMELKIANHRHAEDALAFQAEGMTHMNADEIIAVPYFIKKSPGHVEAVLFTTSKELVQSHIQELGLLLGENLDCLSANGLGLFRYARWRAPALKDVFLVHLGFSEWQCLWIEKGELKKAYSLSLGTEALLAALWEDRKKVLPPKEVEIAAKQFDLQKIQMHLNPHLFAKLDEMRQDLARTILSFHRTASMKPLVFTGCVDAFWHLREVLLESCKEFISSAPAELFDREEQKYAVAIGLALEPKKQPLQFLQREFFPKKHWKKAGFYALSLFVISLLMSVTLFFCGQYMLSQRKAQLTRALQLVLEPWNFTKKIETIPKALDQWISLVRAHSKEYPYVVQAYKVSEVLSWISSHPLLEEFEREQDPFQMRQIYYHLIEIPKIGSSQAGYLAKAEIEFSLKSPIHARTFHEALLKGDHIVDADRDVDWEVLADGYKASFFLKKPRSNSNVP